MRLEPLIALFVAGVVHAGPDLGSAVQAGDLAGVKRALAAGAGPLEGGYDNPLRLATVRALAGRPHAQEVLDLVV